MLTPLIQRYSVRKYDFLPNVGGSHVPVSLCPSPPPQTHSYTHRPDFSHQHTLTHTHTTTNLPKNINSSLSLSLPLYSGGPGSGKGTQSLKIAERYGFQYMSVGELLRKKMIHNATSNRKWSLIETTITEIKQKIMKIPDANGIVIDGFPRDVGQALSFEDQVSLYLVVFLACTNSRLKERLQKRAEQQGRPDDNPKAIDRRLTNFKQNTIPLVKYFQERGLIVTQQTSDAFEQLYELRLGKL
uniref:Uncharacterized protein n=1 Tax=Poecilia mexicana TaxID=48701 RepID=A0A3B3Y0R4_9TELE